MEELLRELIAEQKRTNQLLSTLLEIKATIKQNNFDDAPAMLSYKDLMSLLGISKETAYELMHSKGFPAIRIGRNIKVRKDALLSWLNRRAYKTG